MNPFIFLIALCLSVTVLTSPAHAAKQKPADQTASKEPINIDADQLEVHDKDKTAVFTGHVIAIQGKVKLETNQMKVFYEDAKTSSATPVEPPPAAGLLPSTGQNRKIKRIEAYGAVKVTQDNQLATGQQGVYDMQSSQITLTGNVVLVQNGNVIQGNRLVVDTRTQESKVFSSSSPNGARVRALVLPGTNKNEDIFNSKPASTSPKSKIPTPANARPGAQ